MPMVKYTRTCQSCKAPFTVEVPFGAVLSLDAYCSHDCYTAATHRTVAGMTNREAHDIGY